METSSSACRLHEIIRKAKDILKEDRIKSLGSGRSLKFGSGWKKVLSINSDSAIDIVGRVLEVSYLVKETKKQIIANSDTDEESSHILTNYDQIERAIIPFDMDKDFGDIIGIIDESTLVYLDFGCKLLLKKSPEKVIDEKELFKILEDINNLFEEIINSKINQHIKSYLLESLARMKEGITLYRIRGARYIIEGLLITSGYYNHYMKEYKATDYHEESVINKFIGILNGFNNIVAPTINNFMALACIATSSVPMLPKL